MSQSEMMKIFHFSFPLIALFFSAGIGKWISQQTHWLELAEVKLGKTISRLLLASDNPSLILGVIALLGCFAFWAKQKREDKSAQD